MKPKFRIIEKTTLSGKKIFVPQVGIWEETHITGILWWKESNYAYVYYGLKPQPSSIVIDFNTKYTTRGHGFESTSEAMIFLNEFKEILLNQYEKDKDRLFQEEIKIIDVE
jgi:hypothetical protein